MLLSVCDIGSNTVKFGVYDCIDKNTLPNRAYFESKALKLISHIKDGKLEDNAISQLSELCLNYKESAFKHGAVSFEIFATQCIRSADNKDEICKRIYDKTGIFVDILNGNDEARLSRIAMQCEMPEIKRGVCVDMGGGSSEIVVFDENNIIDSVSLPFGCLVLKNKFVKGDYPSEKEFDDITEYVNSFIQNRDFSDYSNAFCLIGGTAKALENAYNTEFNEKLSYHNLVKLYDFLQTDKAEKYLKKNIPERVETIIPGLIGLIAICNKIKPESVAVIKSGTREGYIIDKYLR